MRVAVIVLFALVSLAGCGGGTRYQPLVAHRSWQTDDQAKVFDAVVRVLHGQDYLIASADKGSGLIATDWKNYQAEEWTYRVRLNLLVLKETEGYTAVDYKSKVQERHPEKTKGEWKDIESNDPIQKDGYKTLTKGLDDFFLEVQRYAGPSVQRR
jgi:hypothetical protein